MSPLTYEPQLPPRTQHSVIDRQGVDWLALFDGLCLHPESYDWRISFRRPGAEAVAYVEPGTSLEHEAFLRDLLAEAEPVQKLIPQTSGPLYDLVESVVGTRVDWRCGEKMFQRHVIRLDPEQVDVKIELTGHVFPTHSDSLRHIIDAVIKEIPVWRKGIKDPPTD